MIRVVFLKICDRTSITLGFPDKLFAHIGKPARDAKGIVPHTDIGNLGDVIGRYNTGNAGFYSLLSLLEGHHRACQDKRIRMFLDNGLYSPKGML